MKLQRLRMILIKALLILLSISILYSQSIILTNNSIPGRWAPEWYWQGIDKEIQISEARKANLDNCDSIIESYLLFKEKYLQYEETTQLYIKELTKKNEIAIRNAVLLTIAITTVSLLAGGTAIYIIVK